MSHLSPLLERNQSFAPTGAHQGLPPIPRHQVFVVTCIDGRLDPAHILGVELGDALVYRNAGGRVTDDVLRDVAFIGEAVSMMSGGEAPDFEVAVIHHTSCGSGFLNDPAFREPLVASTGEDDAKLAALAVTDPHRSVAHDVELLTSSAAVPASVLISGHVYDVETGLVTTVHLAAKKGDR